MVYLLSVENVITLGKLLSVWFCFLLHSILFLKNSNLISYIQNNFKQRARSPCNGNHFSSYSLVLSEKGQVLGELYNLVVS